MATDLNIFCQVHVQNFRLEKGDPNLNCYDVALTLGQVLGLGWDITIAKAQIDNKNKGNNL